jgi:sister chromatid cohesion protein DCC1
MDEGDRSTLPSPRPVGGDAFSVSAAFLSKGTTNGIRFAEDFSINCNNLSLLSVPEALLKEIACNNASIKGGIDDDAMLCTQSSTYSVRLAEASNTLLLLPPGVAPKRRRVEVDEGGTTVADASMAVAGMIENTFILQLVPPKLQKLSNILSQCRYRGPDNEDEQDASKLMNSEQMEMHVQASRKQLEAGLDSIGALQIDGKWRLLHEQYRDEIVQLILGLQVENEWPAACIPEEGCVQNLLEYCPHAVRHCLKMHSTGSPSAAGTATPKNWALDPTKVCRWVAERMMRSGGEHASDPAVFSESVFQENWENNTPSDMTPDLEMLRGIALVEGGRVRHFSVLDLAPQPAARFGELFAHKARWTMQEIQPYLDNLCGDGMTVKQLLANHTRSFVNDTDVRVTAHSTPTPRTGIC